ncbi:MAG TPA: DUF1501 domain-containing protein [Pirellulales bacterium]|nr:DUF1501 domain-containing protein [Pirellulales bacterium]
MARSMKFGRRDWLRLATLGTVAGSQSGWLSALAADAAPRRERKRSVILLWMNGGPATIDLWDLKPGHANGGPFQEIETAAPGVKISEHLPGLARWTKDMAIVRSMSTKEGDHGRATFLSMTGYVPQGAIQFPDVGALVAKEIGEEAADLPGFVRIAPGRNGSTSGGGFLGPRYSPLVIGEGAAGLDDLTVPDLKRPTEVSDAAQSRRLELLAGLERRFEAGRGNAVVETIQSSAARAVRLMRPEAAGAFRLDQESDEVRDAFGRNVFGQGCLLARRLAERGVPFIEVALDGWDTHQNNFERVKDLSTTLDRAFSALLNDLSQRGLLESTLVVCQGEFGRTPKINGNTGRDHWPASWSAVLAGGGVKGGQVVGKTSADGMKVEEQPIGIPDLIATVCTAIGIDPKKQNISNVSRPIRIADPAAKPILEVL